MSMASKAVKGCVCITFFINIFSAKLNSVVFEVIKNAETEIKTYS